MNNENFTLKFSSKQGLEKLASLLDAKYENKFTLVYNTNNSSKHASRSNTHSSLARGRKSKSPQINIVKSPSVKSTRNSPTAISPKAAMKRLKSPNEHISKSPSPVLVTVNEKEKLSKSESISPDKTKQNSFILEDVITKVF